MAQSPETRDQRPESLKRVPLLTRDRQGPRPDGPAVLLIVRGRGTLLHTFTLTMSAMHGRCDHARFYHTPLGRMLGHRATCDAPASCATLRVTLRPRDIYLSRYLLSILRSLHDGICMPLLKRQLLTDLQSTSMRWLSTRATNHVLRHRLDSTSVQICRTDTSYAKVTYHAVLSSTL